MSTTTKVLLRDDNKNPVIGSTLPINITVTGVPDAITFDKAVITFKEKLSDADADIILEKEVTSGFTGTNTVTFTAQLEATETANFEARKYIWDLWVLDNTTMPPGKFPLIPDGVVTWQKPVRQSLT